VENRSGAVPSSSLQHVYFFINQHASASDESTAEVSDDYGEMNANAAGSLNHVYFFVELTAAQSSDGQCVIENIDDSAEAVSG